MRVLVADDSLVMRRLLESALQGWGYDVLSAKDGGEAWAVLQAEDSPSLAILDWMMPISSGLDLCRRVRALDRARYTYLILLTSRGLRQDVVEGLGAGADDYVVKPFDKHELEVRLRAGRRIVALQTELMRTQEALREQAMKDGLTGIWNRGSILDILARELDRASREHLQLGLLMLDLDHFKQVNDNYGHQCGDAALRGVTIRLRGMMRSYDSLGRYGGEEFLIVVPGCGPRALLDQAERLRQTLCAEPFDLGPVHLPMSASFGAASFDHTHPCPVFELVRAADAALYEAKRGGRNRVVSATTCAVAP
jgi:diguanylate cyclase (GGDEF)-like protein